jgi:hypothetical protein
MKQSWGEKQSCHGDSHPSAPAISSGAGQILCPIPQGEMDMWRDAIDII